MSTKKLILLIVICPLLLFAQNGPNVNRKNRPERKINPRVEGKPRVDLDKEPDIASSENMTIDEFLLKRNEFKGQVIELTFDKVVSVKQAGEGYIAMVTYKSPRLAESVNLLVPADGLEFFQKLAKPEIRRQESVYVHILSAQTVKALGRRYSKNKPLGERYSW